MIFEFFNILTNLVTSYAKDIVNEYMEGEGEGEDDQELEQTKEEKIIENK